LPAGTPAEQIGPRPWADSAPWDPKPIARRIDSTRLDSARLDLAFAEHDALALSLRAAREGIVVPLAWAAVPFIDAKGWTLFGFARLDDYARERLDRSGRWLRALARLGRALAVTPRLVAALTGDDGGRPIGCVAALLISRALEANGDGPGDLAIESWIGAARRLSVRALGDVVRRADSPTAPMAPTGSSTPADPDVFQATQSLDPDVVLDGEPADPDVFRAGALADQTPEAKEDRALVRIQVSAPLVAAFDEAVDLHRAVEGREATVTSFVEALVAESGPPDATDRGLLGTAGSASIGAAEWSSTAAVRLQRAPDAVVEEAHRASTDAWADLPEPDGSTQAAVFAGQSLERFQVLDAAAGTGDAAALDRQLRSLLRLDNEMESRLGALLAEMGERGAWSRLRFADAGHYAEERLGLSRSRAEAAAHLARVLRRLPRLRAAREAGRVGAEAAALIARLLAGGPVDPDTEAAWIERGAACTIKRMRDETRALGRYRALGAGRDRAPEAGRDRALESRRDPRRPLDDADWQRSLRREVGTARRRVVALGCLAAGADPDVFRATKSAGALPNTVALPEPDAFLRLRLPESLARAFLLAVESSRCAAAEEAGRTPWDEPWQADADLPLSASRADAPLPPSRVAARIAFVRGRRVPAWVGLLALLEDYVFTWDVDHAPPSGRDDRVLVRDGWRCLAPGCTSRRNLEDHHVVYRARGGSDHLANRICLCRFHHQRGEHGGLMSVRGTAPLRLTWRMGRDAIGGTFRNERS